MALGAIARHSPLTIHHSLIFGRNIFMPRTALVTGGSRGIGAAISKALKAAGYKVAANYAGNDEAANAFTGETGIATYKWSVADYEACVAGIKKVEADLGPVEVLVNNAGITRDAFFHRMTPQQWREVIDTNLNGLFNMTHPVWAGMRERKFGRIVNISSINGQKGQAGQANYSSAKAGDIGFTKALAQEGSRVGITVNAICPGYVRTPLVEKQIPDTARARGISEEQVVRDVLLAAQPTKRFVSVEQVAAFTAFLCGEDAASITGAVLPIEGGWTAH
jgi:acetoacetyl-CoA reductase